MRALIMIAFLLSSPVGMMARAAAPAELEPLTFLLGEWVPAGTVHEGQPNGTATFTRSLQDRVILRSSFAEYPAASAGHPSRHDDLMIIYAGEGGAVRADYYDSEGHVIRYAVRVPEPGKAIFESDSTAGAPRFRLGYELSSDGVLKGNFEIAPPGQPATYKPYLSWESRRR